RCVSDCFEEAEELVRRVAVPLRRRGRSFEDDERRVSQDGGTTALQGSELGALEIELAKAPQICSRQDLVDQNGFDRNFLNIWIERIPSSSEAAAAKCIRHKVELKRSRFVIKSLLNHLNLMELLFLSQSCELPGERRNRLDRVHASCCADK